MKVTIITIGYNNLSGLKRTVPSVLSQTYTDYEYIVIDGGSTDGSKEFLQKFPRIDYWVSEPDKGIYNAMNKGIRAAHGEYCIFINSGDTFFSSQVLENVIDKLQGADFYTGAVTFINETKTSATLPPKKLTFDFLLTESLAHPATFNKTAWLKAHPYNEDLKIVSDWELYIRASLSNCTYEPLTGDMISIFYCDGISIHQQHLLEEERKKILRQIVDDLPEGRLKQVCNQKVKRLYDNVRTDESRNKQKLTSKIERAMELPPLQRDWKIARNAMKTFFKDLFS